MRGRNSLFGMVGVLLLSAGAACSGTLGDPYDQGSNTDPSKDPNALEDAPRLAELGYVHAGLPPDDASLPPDGFQGARWDPPVRINHTFTVSDVLPTAYYVQPFDLDALELAIERVLGSAEITRQNAFLREELNRGWEGFVGASGPMQAVYTQIRQVAPSRATVMITGETGTGKELAARAIHAASPRHDKLFVPINCAAIPAEMLESELFGHEKGAFTGAVKERIGKFELANGGTLFLDEITEMPMALQAKLLRVLQEGTLERLGSNRSITLDLRIIAASNRDPREAIRDGRLREDLFYRLNVFSLALPPLRERKEDIPGLVAHFAAKHGRAGSAPLAGPGLHEHLASYAWPGNVRELENMVERALVLAGDGVLRPAHFSFDAVPSIAASQVQTDDALPSGPMNEVVEALERRLIDDALSRSEGNKTRAAAMLGISERTLWYKLKKFRSVEDG